ncbi:uncharacterized protein LOC143038665 isoform X1 [Oratosquilla oratoria]|uniref:uncharacterized protein LOC143038665 isoform X1 n=1 Tax=Oratosquilla oratoria TaxID=337810 RepID=UPI003F764586
MLCIEYLTALQLLSKIQVYWLTQVSLLSATQHYLFISCYSSNLLNLQHGDSRNKMLHNITMAKPVLVWITYITRFKMPPNGRYSIGTTVALINKKISRFHVPVNWAILLYGILVICFYFH